LFMKGKLQKGQVLFEIKEGIDKSQFFQSTGFSAFIRTILKGDKIFIYTNFNSGIRISKRAFSGLQQRISMSQDTCNMNLILADGYFR